MRVVFSCFVSFFLICLACHAKDQVGTSVTEKTSALTADHITHYAEKEYVEATGNVILSQEDRILRADTVRYYPKSDKAIAEGNVIIQEKTGDYIFADRIEVSGDMKDAFATEIRMIMVDDGKMAAQDMVRKDGTQTTFDRVVYSPCEVAHTCGAIPFWQIKGRTARWDQEKHDIEYTDAFMEFFGVPFLYTPYLSHPDPTVKRRSGFLPPSFMSNKDVGFMGILPYYYVISDDKDITFTPMIGAKTQILAANYRQKFSKGDFGIRGSIGHVQTTKGQGQKAHRWNIETGGVYNLNQNWRTGFKINRVSDRTYTRRFPKVGGSSKPILTSKVFAEGFYGRSYTRVQGLSYQTLRANDTERAFPWALPEFKYQFVGNPQALGNWWTFDADALILQRRATTANNMRRVSLMPAYHLPLYGSWGDRYQVDLSLRGDVYSVSKFPIENGTRTISATSARTLPKGAVHWWFPLYRNIADSPLILKPRASIIASPNTSQGSRIPNEDSRIFELSDVNVFDDDRTTGLDRMDTGTRIAYGLESSYYGFGTAPTNVLIAQSYNLHRPRDWFVDSGEGKRASDYILRLQAYPTEYFRFRYRARLDEKTLRSNRSELTADVGRPILMVGGDYIQVAKPKDTNHSDKQGEEQLRLRISSQFVKNWTAFASTIRALGRRGGTLENKFGLAYSNECFTSRITATRTFYRDADIKPGTTVLFEFVFKNLGGVSYTSNAFGDTTPEETSN